MHIDLHKLIEDRKLNRSHLSQVLFPTHKHPAMALTRLLSKRTSLDEEQVFRLSMFTGLTVDALYRDSLHWKRSHTGGLVRFSRDKYSAVYSPTTGITKVYHLEKLLATHILSKPNQPLDVYLSEIDEIVINKSIKQ